MKQIVKTSLVTGTSLVAVVGLVFAPTFQASAVTGNDTTVITATVAPVITVSSGATVAFTLTPSTGVAESNASNAVLVTTNNTSGYNLSLEDNDATLTLVDGANSIAVSANTYAAPATLATNAWGYAVAGGNFSATYSVETDVTTSALKYAGITASPQVIKTTASAGTNDSTTVWYAAKVDTSKPTGNYVDTVKYVATTNP